MAHPAESAHLAHDDHHGHGGSVFDNPKIEREADRLGMWLFLVTEVLFFGGIFLAYTIYRWLHPEAFSEASGYLNLTLGTVNTLVLLTSSMTMAFAVRAAQLKQKKSALIFLGITFLFALTFLCVKAVEYTADWNEGLVPGEHFSIHTKYGPEIQLFLAIYFAATGLHGFHIVLGMGVMIWLAVRIWRETATDIPVEMVGLYWHFVDVVWVFLLPILYMGGPAHGHH